MGCSNTKALPAAEMGAQETLTSAMNVLNIDPTQVKEGEKLLNQTQEVMEKSAAALENIINGKSPFDDADEDNENTDEKGNEADTLTSAESGEDPPTSEQETDLKTEEIADSDKRCASTIPEETSEVTSEAAVLDSPSKEPSSGEPVEDNTEDSTEAVNPTESVEAAETPEDETVVEETTENAVDDAAETTEVETPKEASGDGEDTAEESSEAVDTNVNLEISEEVATENTGDVQDENIDPDTSNKVEIEDSTEDGG